MRSRKTLLGALLELCVLLLPSVLFLVIYVGFYHAPKEVFLIHLYRVAPLFLLVMAVRLVVAKFFNRSRAMGLFASMVLSVSVLLLLTYYLLVLVGLSSWGRVISWPLISAYSTQLGFLLDVIGASRAWLFLLTLPFGLGFYLSYRYLSLSWLTSISEKWSQAMGFILPLTLIALSVIAILDFMQKKNGGDLEEPIALTFYYERYQKQLQTHSMQASNLLEHHENEARANYRPSKLSSAPNVIVIVVDALRAKQLSLYGYERQTTPYLAQLYASGQMVKIDGVRSICSESACGLMGLASSRYLHQFVQKPFLLTEALKLHGYQIHMILGGDHTSFYNLKEAYGATDSYFDAGHSKESYRNDDKTLLTYLNNFPKASESPAYLQFHLMSVHALGTRHPEYSLYQPVQNYYKDFSRVLGGQKPGPLIERINYYDNGVRQADAMVEHIMAQLGSKGYLNNAVVIITADHGESLGEHELYGHVEGVYESMLSIPLLMLRYGGELNNSLHSQKGLFSQIDIAPTILHEVGIAAPSTWQGHPLHKTLNRDTIFFEQKKEVGLIEKNSQDELWKYWQGQGQRPNLHNLNADPGEENNLVSGIYSEKIKQWKIKLAPLMAKSAELITPE